MRVLLIDVDSKIPNLALMKLSAHHKDVGNEVFLNDCEKPDLVCLSCVFTGSRQKAISLLKKYPSAILIVGGSGWNLKDTLPYKIEHIMPDYSLYGCDFSVGFTSRGCIRKCSFCIVPQKEGRICDNAPISEFLSPKHHKLILLDNNFLASPRWKENTKLILERELEVNFSQGLDFRLLTQENLELLSKVRTKNHTFKSNRIHFALDSVKYLDLFKKKMEMLLKHIKPYRIMVYILCGFDSTFEQDYIRFKMIKDFDFDPYIMLYNKTEIQHSRCLRDFARWVNRRLYRVCDLKDYDGSIKHNA